MAYSYHEGADGATANRDPVAAGAAAASALAPQVSAGGGSAWDAPVAPGLRAQADGLDAYFRERATPQALLSAAAGAIAELKAASVDTLRGTGGSSDAGTVVEDAIASDDEENEFIPATLTGGAVGAASSLFPAINLRDGLGEDALSPLASAAASMSAAAAGGASSAGASRGGAAYTVAGAANNAATVSLGTGSSLPGSANVTYASAGVRTALPASLMSVEEMQISLTDGRVEAIVNERAVALLTCVRTQLQQAHRRGDEALRGVYVDRAETILRVMQEEGVDVDSRVVAAYISVVISSGFPHKLRTVMPMLGGLPSGSAARHFNKVLCELASPDTAATILRMLPDLTAFGVRPAAATLDTLSRMATDKWLRGQSVTCPQCLELRTGACANAAPVPVARAPPASPPSSASMTDGSRLSVDAGLLADVQEPIAPADAKPRRARRTVENYKPALLNAFASERRGSTVVTCAAASEQQAASVHSVHTHTVFPSQQLKLFESAGTLSELPPITTIRLALAATRYVPSRVCARSRRQYCVCECM
ncbi:MAG: hypothetical protein EOO41_01020 [Methanobacteriota archaeon]|nr:MAG: hypothetical protein EOO41_01020 [Euryarchaeota archaeon]